MAFDRSKDTTGIQTALGRFWHHGFILDSLDDHLLFLLHENERIAIFTKVGANMRRVTCRAILPAFTVTLLLILLTVTGCVKPQSTPNLTPESTDQPVDTQPTLPQNEDSPSASEPFLKIIIYTDFQCGACEKFNSEIEPELRERYAATGKAQIEIRLLGALGIDSLRAAEAALCASDQGRFFEYKNALFRAWKETGANAYSTEGLVKLAKSVGLDEEMLKLCLESESKRTELEKNMGMAQADGVRVLPTVIVDGIKVEGNKPLDTYIQVIERETTQ